MESKHVDRIKDALRVEPHLACNRSPVVGLICKDQCDCPEKFDRSKLERGEYIIEALDGNRSSTAMKQLALKFPNEINFKERQCILYAGLSDEDALYIGYRNNEYLKKGRMTNTLELLVLMRRQLFIINGSDEKVDNITADNKATRGKWHEFLRRLLNAPVSLLFRQWLRLSPVCYSCNVNFNC